ncbi:MAG: YfiR family protein [candidate division WOR-3 bacterium]
MPLNTLRRLLPVLLSFYLSQMVAAPISSIEFAQEMPVPMDLQLPLLLKVLTFDRNLKSRVGKEIVIGVIYQEKFRASLLIKDEFLRVLKELPIKDLADLPIKAKPIALGDEAILKTAIINDSIAILYVTPLRAFEISTIQALAGELKVLTLTGVPEYVKSGLAVGVGTKGERPLIIINLTQAKAEGADFSSQLLNLAKVITN